MIVHKITDRDIIRLLGIGRYRVDPKTGDVFGKAGKKIRPYNRERYRHGHSNISLYVRLYCGDRRRGIALARLVWMSVTGRVIPRGFEIHHRDVDYTNNAWDNLYCLFGMDHRKLHNGDLINEPPPF